MDALNPYFLFNDEMNKPTATRLQAYDPGPPILTPDADLSEQPGREIWLGERIPSNRLCPDVYLRLHGINTNRNRPKGREPNSSNHQIK